MKKILLTLVTACAIGSFIASDAEARYDSRPYSGFGHGQCKRASCFAKHPGGSYTYPYHYGHSRH